MFISNSTISLLINSSLLLWFWSPEQSQLYLISESVRVRRGLAKELTPRIDRLWRLWRLIPKVLVGHYYVLNLVIGKLQVAQNSLW